MRFAYVDVFAPRPLSGNPVVVVVGADDQPDAALQALAREFNQSETAFVVRADGGRSGAVPENTGSGASEAGSDGTDDRSSTAASAADWRLRSFTPTGAEVFGAGHNALGAVVWLAASGRLPQGRSSFVQAIGDESFRVDVSRATPKGAHVAIRQSPPRTLGTVDDGEALARALGVEPEAVVVSRVPEVISTGAGHLLVPLRSRGDVEAAAPDARLLSPLLAAAGAEGCAIFSLDPEEEGAHAHLRFFNPTMGIQEDPATGTAAGPLAVKLLRDGLIDPVETVIIVQGHATGRPSRIAVDVDGDVVTLHGDGIVVAEGSIDL